MVAWSLDEEWLWEKKGISFEKTINTLRRRDSRLSIRTEYSHSQSDSRFSLERSQWFCHCDDHNTKIHTNSELKLKLNHSPSLWIQLVLQLKLSTKHPTFEFFVPLFSLPSFPQIEFHQKYQVFICLIIYKFISLKFMKVSFKVI